jgi:hypothetical protein
MFKLVRISFGNQDLSKRTFLSLHISGGKVPFLKYFSVSAQKRTVSETHRSIKSWLLDNKLKHLAIHASDFACGPFQEAQIGNIIDPTGNSIRNLVN